jgi:succinate dehydrogenase/fumarate reductase iron-sulfur protein
MFFKNLSQKTLTFLSSFNVDPNMLVQYKVFRYDPFLNAEPWVQLFFISNDAQSSMLLDNLFYIKNEKDESFSFRRSCREGICGSCAMNINGENALSCLYIMKEHINAINNEVRIFPLPHMPVVKDLIVCMKHFYLQYKSINPFLLKHNLSYALGRIKTVERLYFFMYNLRITASLPKKENIQHDRYLLNGLYECILCACCSTSCPSYWWNKDRYLGPAILLQSYRWLIDSRDDFFYSRLAKVDDVYKIGRCHSILNCVSCCPKGLNPAEAINNIKLLIHLNSHSN